MSHEYGKNSFPRLRDSRKTRSQRKVLLWDSVALNATGHLSRSNTKMHYIFFGARFKWTQRVQISLVVCSAPTTEHAKLRTSSSVNGKPEDSISISVPKGQFCRRSLGGFFAQSALQRSLNFNVNLTAFIDCFLLFSAFEKHWTIKAAYSVHPITTSRRNILIGRNLKYHQQIKTQYEGRHSNHRSH